MNRDKFMFSISIFLILFGVAHINKFAVYIAYEKRSTGKLCVFMDTTFTRNEVYFRNEDLGRGAVGCPVYNFID